MQKAEELVVAYIEAGYTKIHLDTSMKLRGDCDKSFNIYKIAERGARLCCK
jgi:D-tagatose-1,6-bisphosphate aldolase subunit GatZ/KbaZ